MILFSDKLIANFLFDPYARPSTKLSGIRMEMGRGIGHFLTFICFSQPLNLLIEPCKSRLEGYPVESVLLLFLHVNKFACNGCSENPGNTLRLYRMVFILCL